ncbi:MAG: carboxypeptidase regulatory-like domain-containing protein [Bacteroidia bacterium]
MGLCSENNAQEWKLKLSSNVELRTWKLTTKAESQEKPLLGANIKLMQGSSVVAQVNSDANGDFTLMVPPGGNYIIEVSYPGCNTKRFAVTTKDVPDAVGEGGYVPSFSIGGFVMAKPFPGIDYSGLSQALVKVIYEPKLKNFDDEEAATQKGLEIVSKIAQAEDVLITNFCSTNKAGDVALNKPDCPLAKTLYEKAITIIPGEPYPVEQLPKVGLCLKDKEDAEKKAQEEKLAREKEIAEKAEKDRIAKEKAEADKAAKAKAAEEKAIADKLAKEKALNEKSAVAQTAKEKAEAEKIAKAKTAAEKAEADRLAKEKALAEKTATAKPVKEKPQKTTVAPKEPVKDKPVVKADPPAGNGFAVKGSQPSSGDPQVKGQQGDSKHKVRQTLGADKYKECITKANDYMKSRRYTEAKASYQEALKLKANDVYAKAKLAEIEKLEGLK